MALPVTVYLPILHYSHPFQLRGDPRIRLAHIWRKHRLAKLWINKILEISTFANDDVDFICGLILTCFRHGWAKPRPFYYCGRQFVSLRYDFPTAIGFDRFGDWTNALEVWYNTEAHQVHTAFTVRAAVPSQHIPGQP